MDRNEHFEPWARPILRWAGSKRKLLPSLVGAMPKQFGRYIEPFAGSACLFFAVNPKSAILGDINAELLDTYVALREHPRLVARAVHAMPKTEAHYYRLRREEPRNLSPVNRAARFIYLNRHCFNGVYRTNQRGAFNVPRGRRTGAIPSEAKFVRCARALKRAVVRPGDFESCLRDLKPNDFVYLDPPYATESRPIAGEYGYGCFDGTDHPRLAAWLKKIDDAGARFLLSYSDCADLHERFRKAWICNRFLVHRHVAGFAKHRGQAAEILVSNYAM